MLNPCCCISPRIGTFIFAVVDLIVGLSTVFWAVKQVLDSTEIIDTWIEFGFAILLLFLAILLLYGTIKNSYENVRLWLVLWTVLIILFIVFQIFNVARAPTGGSGSRAWRFSSMGGTLLLIYQIWVVWAFATELRYGPNALTYCPAQIV